MDIESEISEILQENLGNLIRGNKGIKIEKFRAVCKSYLEIQWKSKKKFVWDKNSVLAVDEFSEVLLQSKENQNCLGLIPTRCALVLS